MPRLLVVLVATASLFPCVGVSQSLRILHIDVDQADATLIVSPAGNTLLVDAGKDGHGDRIRAAMTSVGVNDLDHVVVTHYHEDHYGGIDELAETPVVPVGQVHDRGDKQFLPDDKKEPGTIFDDYESALGHRAHHIMRGETINLDPDMLVVCISSGGAVLSENPALPGADENDMSISLLIQYGDFRYFIGGDIEHHTEEKIAELNVVQDVDVYQANHHGSHTSSSTDFITDLSPSAVIISNGNHGGFHHPRQDTLDSFAGLIPSAVVFQTNKYLKGDIRGGNVTDDFIADIDPTGAEGTIEITVQPSGGYTVSYRSEQHIFQSSPVEVSDTVSIEELLPDPLGSDRQREEVSLRNNGPEPISMDGWFLRDARGSVWILGSVGVIEPGESETVVRLGMAMSLNNDGDSVELLDPRGRIVDAVTYQSVSTGERISTTP